MGKSKDKSVEEQSYDELVRLANDPTTSNEERDAYRARMNALFGDRLREGFSSASQPATGTRTP